MRRTKRMLAFVLSMLLIVIAVPIQSKAAVKISAASKTLYVGKSITLKVSGATQKAKWSTSNKKVATVTQKGKVTGKQDGTATITAKVGAKSLKCKVTVKTKFSASEAKKNISISSYVVQDGGIAVVKNNYKLDVMLDISFAFYDENGTLIKTAKEEYIRISKGKTSIAYGETYDNNAKTVKTTISGISECSETNQPEKIKVSDDSVSGGSIVAQVDNNGGNYEYVRLSCVLYKNGVPVGCTQETLNNISGGSSDFISFYIPEYKKYGYDEDGYYDWTYEKIDFDDYKIYVDYAYRYNW